MAAVMANCIRRSFCVNGYSPKMTYRESLVYPSWMAGIITLLQMAVVGTAILTPPLKWLFLATGMIPQPGEGPSESAMDQGANSISIFLH